VAGELWQGAHIRKADGTFGTVEQINIVERAKVMYNLTVAQAHTFFVGDNKWLVHNECTIKPSGLVKPSDLAGKSLEEVTSLFNELEELVTVDKNPAFDGGFKRRWEEDGNLYEVRYHAHANPNIPANQPSGAGPTIKFGQIVVGDGGKINNEQWIKADKDAVESARGRAYDNRPPPKTARNKAFGSHRRSQYVDPWGVVYFNAQNELAGRFTNSTHILGFGNKLLKP
jgi:hypothetical protein